MEYGMNAWAISVHVWGVTFDLYIKKTPVVPGSHPVMSVSFNFVGGKSVLPALKTPDNTGGHVSGVQIWSSLYLQLASILRNDRTFLEANGGGGGGGGRAVSFSPTKHLKIIIFGQFCSLELHKLHGKMAST